jgi:hypothetical protein
MTRKQFLTVREPKAKLIRSNMDGVLAQLVEHHNGIVGVESSSLSGSTIFLQRVKSLFKPRQTGDASAHIPPARRKIAAS